MRIFVTPDRKAVILNDDATWTDAPSCHSALERWKSLTLSPDLVERFQRVFDRLGVRITEWMCSRFGTGGYRWRKLTGRWWSNSIRMTGLRIR